MAKSTWAPLGIFAPVTAEDAGKKAALLILNCGNSLRGLEEIISEKWSMFGLHICADGGANSLYDSLPQDERSSLVPEFLVGDLDSVRTEVLDFYKPKGMKLVKDDSDDKTDFTKSIYLIQSLKEYDVVYVVNTMWGRMDQLIGNLYTLFSFDHPKIYLLSETSVSFALQKGHHNILVDTNREEGHCGFFPFCGPCRSCTTSGCRWNLDNQSMEVTGLFSSCNLIDDNYKEITLSCSDPVLFTLTHNLVSKSKQ